MDGFDKFQQRVARIKAAKPQSYFAGTPLLAAGQTGDISEWRRNATRASHSSFTDSLFELSAVRYGFPVAVGVLGLAMMTAVFPEAPHTAQAPEDTFTESTDTSPPFNSSEIALNK